MQAAGPVVLECACLTPDVLNYTHLTHCCIMSDIHVALLCLIDQDMDDQSYYSPNPDLLYKCRLVEYRIVPIFIIHCYVIVHMWVLIEIT